MADKTEGVSVLARPPLTFSVRKELQEATDRRIDSRASTFLTNFPTGLPNRTF